MKVTYDSYIFGAQVYGGISRYFCELASRVAKAPNLEVSITAPMHINAYLEHMPPGIVSGFHAPNMDRFQTSSGRNYPRLATRALGLLLGDWMLRLNAPDVVHETYFSPYRLGPSRLRRVITIHDMIHEKFASSFPLADKTSRYKARAAERADHIICVSESTQRDVIDILGVPTEKTSVIHHGFGLMNTCQNDIGSLPLPTNLPYLLYVGNRGGYKNFLSLLEVYGRSPQLKSDFELVCFGGGAFNLDELKSIQKLGLGDGRVKQLSGNDHLLANLYKNASAFIYPSLYEGFGIPPLEAMSHGCPVVCSNTSSMPEVVGDAGEYFDPTDQNSIKAAIERVVASDNYRELLISKGYERLKYFSWDHCAAKTLDVYKKLV